MLGKSSARKQIALLIEEVLVAVVTLLSIEKADTQSLPHIGAPDSIGKGQVPNNSACGRPIWQLEPFDSP